MTPAEVFLVFRPRAATAGLQWWQRVLDPWRAHVLAVLPDGPARSIALDAAGTVLRVETIDMSAEDVTRGLMWQWDAEGLRVPRAALPPPRACLRGPMTCVETVKALLGLRSWRIWTPRQLRRAVIRLGARPVPPFPTLAPQGR